MKPYSTLTVRGQARHLRADRGMSTAGQAAQLGMLLGKRRIHRPRAQTWF